MMTTTTRAIINIIERHNNPKELSKLGLMHRTMGAEIKQYLAKISNINIIDDDEFSSYIIDIIGAVYQRNGVPAPDFIAQMFGIDEREDELALRKAEAEIDKIEAQVEEIRSSK